VASLSTPLRTTLAPARQAERAIVPAGRVLAVVSLGYLLASWAMNPVSAVLPTITADLAIDVARAGWVMNAYFLLLVGWVLIAGRLGDAFGHGTVFRAGCLVFAVGSLLGALPGDYPMLLVGRAVQGLGSAMLFGTSLALVTAAYQGRRLGWAVGILTVSSGASSLIGVWLNTALVQQVDWHWTFVVPAVLGVTAAMLGRGLPAARRARASEVDWPGGGLLFGALVLLLLGLNHLHDGPETFEAGAPYHLSMHLAGLGLLAAFLWRQARAARPLVQLRAFRNARLTTGVVANGIAHSSMLATGLLIPFLLERGRGYSPSQTAQLVVAMQVSLIAASYGGGWLYSRHNTPVIAGTSLGAIAGGLLLLGRVGADLPLPALFPLVAVLGAGLGSFTAVNNSAVMTAAPADQRGFASGLVEMMRQLGHSLGVSVSSSVLAARLATAGVPSLGYRDGFAEAASVMGLVSATGVLCLLLPRLRERLRLRTSRG
jgi:MFS family permease